MPRQDRILYLSRADVERLGLTPAACLPVIEAAFAALAAGDAVNGAKTGLFASTTSFSYAMPALLKSEGVAGVKWVSGAENTGRDIPGIAGVIVLSDVETAQITAVLDGDVITAVRTAAVTLAGARRLARSDSARVGFVACGVQAVAHFDALRSVFPLADVACFSRRRETAERFAAMVRGHGITATVVESAPHAVAGRDIVITSVPRGAEVRQELSPGLLAPGTFVGAPDLARTWIRAEVEGFDRILTDDVAQSHGLGKKGMIPWQDRFDAGLAELITGACSWEPDARVRTMFVHAGIGLGDIAVARFVVARAVEQGVGTMLPR
jgi:ornithine cyclodeaminase/alanine dehydrogenase